MADWVRDLQNLLGGLAPGEENLPFDELQQGNWGGAATAPLTAAFNAMDAPLQFVQNDLIGGAMGQAAMLQNLTPFASDTTRRREELARQGKGGDIWDEWVEDKPMALQAILELGLDPVNYTGIGLVGKAGRLGNALAGAEGVVGNNAKFIRSAANSAEAMDVVFNRIPFEAGKRLVNNPVTRPIGRSAKAGIERVIPDAFEIAPKYRIGRKVSDIGTAWANKLDSQSQSVWGRNLPVPWNAPGKSLAPIFEYETPPFFDTRFDAGVPSAVKAKAFEAHKRLAAKHMSFPDIPGVNTPGQSKAFGPTATGFPRIAGGKAPLLDRLPSWAKPGVAGIVQGASRRTDTHFATPFDLNNLTPDDLYDMAQIGAAAMVDFDNQTSNNLFAGILRTGPGFQAVRKKLISEYGPGIEPVLPAMFEQFRETLAEEGVSIGEAASRFFTHWGFPSGELNTKQLDKLQKKLDKGKISRDDAIKHVLLNFNKTTPGVAETAAGMGGGFLSTTAERQAIDPAMTQFGGDFGISGDIAKETGRAAVPGQFTSSFNTNREQYNTYMRQLFGHLEDDELEVLRTMSIESLYDEMINAAGERSGGRYGATKLLDSSRTGVEPEGDEYAKISARGTRETDISQRLGEFQETGKINSKLNKIELRQANAEIYEREIGKPPPGGWSNAKIEQALRSKDILPFTENKKGGPLAAVSEIVDFYKAGKELTPGGHKADKFYDDAVEEIMNIVGPGRYDDALMLMELVAVTSSGTSVEANAENAIRAFAEWKLGSDDAIRNQLNLTPEQVDTILNRGQRWDSVQAARKTKKGEEALPLPGDELFMSAMARSQKKTAGKVFAEFVRRQDAIDAGWSPTQGGPKTNNFAGSHVIKLWMHAIDQSLGDSALGQRVRKALDEAATIYTYDRHESRVDNLATAVTPMGAIVNREARIIANKQLPDVRPEDMQAGVWFWSKDQQGFVPTERTDDMANALREVWNRQIVEKRKIEPGLDARIRSEIKEQHPDWDEAQILEGAEDLMRQEAVLAIIKDQLKGVKGFDVSDLEDAGETVLGLIHRSARGVAPKMRVGPQIPRLVSIAENELKRVDAGETIGSTYKWTGTDFAPDDSATGFAVALTSAGKAVSTKTRKTSAKAINDFLIKYGDVLDDPAVAENIRFGIFKMGEKDASFDLTVVVPDEATAIELGRRHNQQSIYDIGTGSVIDVGGSGEPVSISPDALRGTIESLFGRNVGPQEGLADVRARGVTIEEMDSVNPISILQRKVVQPIMDRFRESSEMAARAGETLPSPRQGVPVESPDPTSPVDFGELYQDPMLSTQENMLLAERFDGEAVGTRLDRYHSQITQDLATLDAAGVMWGPNTPLKDRLDKVKDSPELTKIVNAYADEGIDIRYADPKTSSLRKLEREMGKAEGIDIERQTVWDLVRAAWGEQALFSPKYHLGNIQGAWIQNAFGGTFRSGTPAEYLAAHKLTNGGLDEVSKKEVMNSLYVGQVALKWGFENIPGYLHKGGVRSMTSSKSRISGSATGELVGRFTKNERLGRTVGKPFEWNADMSQAVETVMRGSLWGDVLDREMRNSVAILEDEIATMAHRQGLESFEFSFTKNINPVPGGPSPKRLKDHLQNLGFSEGYAERAGRNFSEARNKAEKMARAEVDKRQFSYDRTNLDEFVSKFIPFHYWYSRALRYYGEEAVRHPYLVLNYMRANEGIEAAQEDPGLNARQKGFLRLMGSPLGFTLLMNPDALFGVVKVFGFDSPDIDIEGETQAGGVIRFLKERGLGLYPWIDGTLNLMGTYGQTFEPDLLGIRHKTLIGAAVNFMRSQLGMDPAAAPYQTAMGNARYNVSSFVSQFAPDWLSQPVLPKAGNNTTEATMDTLIESRVIQLAQEQGMHLTNQQLLDIMTDQEDPTYQEAFQQVATAGLAQQLINFTAPQNYRVREASRDVRNAQTSTIWEAAQKQGVSPTEFKPSVADVSFATKYKDLTGKDWKPGDYANAQAKSELTRATTEAKPFVLQENEFYSLGSEKDRDIFQKYNDIRQGKHPDTAGLDEDTRRIVADNWADKLGYRANIDYVYKLRDTYEATHPEFAQFRGWQDQMYSLSNHLGGNLGEYRRQAAEQNPNAANYFSKMTAEVHENYPQDQWSDEIERRTTNSEAYQAITGQKQDRYDPAPVPGFPQGDVTMGNMGLQQQQSAYNPSYDWYQAMQDLQY